MVVGYWALCKNGVPATDNGFLQVVMTTRGNRELDQLAAGGCLGGKNNVPERLEKLEVVFGELTASKNGDGLADGNDRSVMDNPEARGIALAGFGSKDEVVPLRKRQAYGVQYNP